MSRIFFVLGLFAEGIDGNADGEGTVLEIAAEVRRQCYRRACYVVEIAKHIAVAPQVFVHFEGGIEPGVLVVPSLSATVKQQRRQSPAATEGQRGSQFQMIVIIMEAVAKRSFIYMLVIIIRTCREP